MDWIVAHWDDVALLITSVIGVASIVVRLTPSPSDDVVLGKVKGFISKFIALNPK